MATAQLQNIVENQLTLEDVQAQGPEILAAKRERAPADTMFGNELRMASVNVLAKYRFKEGQGSVDHDYNGGKGNLVWYDRSDN